MSCPCTLKTIEAACCPKRCPTLSNCAVLLFFVVTTVTASEITKIVQWRTLRNVALAPSCVPNVRPGVCVCVCVCVCVEGGGIYGYFWYVVFSIFALMYSVPHACATVPLDSACNRAAFTHTVFPMLGLIHSSGEQKPPELVVTWKWFQTAAYGPCFANSSTWRTECAGFYLPYKGNGSYRALKPYV
jgi:hypothetical protein